MDSQKKGFVTFSTLIDTLPIKFGIFLTINQSIEFFSFLDTNNDGILIYEEFKTFFETNYSSIIFEEKYYNLNVFCELFVNNLIIFLNKTKIDLRNLFEYLDINNKGYLMLDDVIKFFKDIVELRMGKHEIKLLFDYLFNEKKVKRLSYRKFLIFLELMGINIKQFTNFLENNECIDLYLLQLINKMFELGLDNIGLIYNFFSEYDINNDGFLEVKEFSTILQKLQIGREQIYSLVYRFNEKAYTNLIPISTLSLVINYFQMQYRNKEFNRFDELNFNKISEIFVYCPSLMDFNNQSSNLKIMYKDYENLLYKGYYSGLIIYSKIFENDNFTDLFKYINKNLQDYLCSLGDHCNHILKTTFNLRIPPKFDKEQIICDYTKIVIPNVTMGNLEIRELEKISNIGETFIYFNLEYKKHMRVYKFRRSDLIKIISTDGQSLINQIEHSIKFYHYLATEEASIYCAKFGNKCSNYFFMNHGMTTKDTTINKKCDEEIYVFDELIDTDDYICLSDSIRNNGGLLSVPDLFNTDMVFYMIKFWGRQILKVFNLLHKFNICFKYINLTDIFISKDGLKIKFKKNMNLSYFNKNGKVLVIFNLDLFRTKY